MLHDVVRVGILVISFFAILFTCCKFRTHFIKNNHIDTMKSFKNMKTHELYFKKAQKALYLLIIVKEVLQNQ